MQRTRISINARLVAAMSFLALLLIVVGALGLTGMITSNNANRRTYSEQLPKSIAVGEMTIMVGRQRTSLDRAAIDPGSEDARNMYEKEKEVQVAAAAAWNKYLSLPRDEEEDRLASSVTRQYEATEAELGRFREATQRADRDEILKLMFSVGKIYTSMQEAANALKKYQFEQSASQYAETEQRYQWLLWSSIAAIVAGVCAAVGGWHFLRKAILSPVNDAIAHFELIARGNLSSQITVKSHDEMGNMLHGLSEMQSSLRKTVGTLRAGSAAIATATREIAAGNADLSARTESQASSLQETATSAEQLSTTVRQNADSVDRASELSASASDIARRGHDVVSRVVTTMGEISRNSTAVAEITSIIEGIAFQTNILALNAAVEAARAGDQGRGFAVVAGEVRTLAQRSSGAAKEIRELIANSTASIDGGAKLVSEAGDTMSQLIDAVSRTHAIMAEISAATQEQSHGLSQVSIAVTDMDSATQQNAALVEQASAAASSLEHQARMLAEAAAAFTLDERAA
ncbi:methyl-accepting chemotaxis protein [Caballeronia sp. LZ035]|uniref:methyl-accepting chemotaxis protein n=1 Tax=Caballeronia sp. LZ035 TaxID=3038568 RepID=UPI002854A3C4|nr:methyl-accepting chemotaxis protein [Caballeronia sp. LZ035]MDR5758776.1 methyl-accepting chemotaxis protein [Caballeronia sp. LZ035]